MIIYRDCISQDEMFSDIYKIREVANGLCLEVEGKMVTRTEGQIDDSLIGGNASAEGPEGDGTEATVITGVDIVINHHLQETSFTKESYKKYIKDYMKAIKARLEEHKPERVKPFMTGAAEQIKHILANFKNYQFFVGENMNPDGMVALLDFREDGVTPYMIFFKDGLEIEKCSRNPLQMSSVGSPIALPSHCGLRKSVYSQLNLSVKPLTGLLECKSCKDEPTSSVEQQPNQRSAFMGQSRHTTSRSLTEGRCLSSALEQASPGRCLLSRSLWVSFPTWADLLDV